MCSHACVDSPFALTRMIINWLVFRCWASMMTATIWRQNRIGISWSISDDFWRLGLSSLARDVDFWWFLCHGEQSPSRPVDWSTAPRKARNRARNSHLAGTGAGGSHSTSTLHTCSQPSIREGDIKGLGPPRMGSSPTYLGIYIEVHIEVQILAFEVYVEHDSVPTESMYGNVWYIC